MTIREYRAFAREMMKLCKKHGIRMRAFEEGHVILGPAKGRIMNDFPYSEFEFSPEVTTLGAEHDVNFIKMEKDSE